MTGSLLKFSSMNATKSKHEPPGKIDKDETLRPFHLICLLIISAQTLGSKTNVKCLPLRKHLESIQKLLICTTKVQRENPVGQIDSLCSIWKQSQRNMVKKKTTGQTSKN